MDITPNCVAALTWVLKDSLGETLDELDQPVDFLVGSDDLLPAISRALQGHAPGAVVDLNLEPEHAFGDFDEELVYLAPRSALPMALEEGMLVDATAVPASAIAGAPADAVFTVTDVYPDHVVLDANHPLAGIGLRLRLKVVGVREATEDELERGSAGGGFFRIQPQAPGSALVQ